MKLNDVKHNHSLTDLLKILIFSILMMIPFIDVGIRCAYVVCNKNAYQSYYGETINEKTLNYTNDLQVNKTYYINPANLGTLTTSGNANQNIIINNGEIINNDTYDFTNIKYVRLYFSQSGNLELLCFENSTTAVYDIYLTSLSNVFKFDFVSFTPSSAGNVNMSNYNELFYYYTYNQYSYLDNVFDYSVNKLTTSELYTWTQQTAIYTGVQTMCTHLGINNSFMPLLLVYWFILTIIYIIIDIVLKLFTMLTHAIGSKTA